MWYVITAKMVLRLQRRSDWTGMSKQLRSGEPEYGMEVCLQHDERSSIQGDRS